MKFKYSYLIKIQFLGFRYHGWQKQTNAKTLHEMVDKTFNFMFDSTVEYKTLGVGRTDSKVSASVYAFQLFIDVAVDESCFIEEFNINVPADINGLSIEKVCLKFNIIQTPKTKEYHYYFSFGNKNHPFAAPFIVGISDFLDIDLMKNGATLFKGEHYFHKYCTKPSQKTVFKRQIDSCEIIENTILTASFFPENSYIFKVKGKGFLRYQIRLMMATLFELGKGNIDLSFIENSLKEDNDRMYLKNIAPSSGLQLFDIEFNS